MLKSACFAMLLMLATPLDALAYVDPGTGSYVFQLAIAGGLAALYTVRHYWQSLKATIRSWFGGNANRASDSQHGVD
jgi:hypothetical protein